jgi:PhnB protein
MFRPAGYSSVTPYVFAENAESYVAFLVAALGGREIGRSLRPDGLIANCQVSVSGAVVMVSEASEGFPPSRAAYYLYVEDADASVDHAVQCGAELIMAVDDMPYGDRQGGVRDPGGNIWWISTRMTDEPYFT